VSSRGALFLQNSWPSFEVSARFVTSAIGDVFRTHSFSLVNRRFNDCDVPQFREASWPLPIQLVFFSCRPPARFSQHMETIMKFAGDAKFYYQTEGTIVTSLQPVRKHTGTFSKLLNPVVPGMGAHPAVNSLYLFGCTHVSPAQEA
jgi:hypothetical protein